MSKLVAGAMVVLVVVFVLIVVAGVNAGPELSDGAKLFCNVFGC